MKKLTYNLLEAIKKEKSIIYINLFLIILGVIFGSIFINFITDKDKALLVEQITNYIDNISKLDKSLFGLTAFKGDFLSNLLEISIIFVLGISMIGIIVIVFILFLKGFMLGVSLSVFILKYKYKGILAIILYLVPCTLINLLIYIFISFFAVYASKRFLKALFCKKTLDFKTFIGKYFFSFILSLFFIIISSLLNSFLLPILLKIFCYIK